MFLETLAGPGSKKTIARTVRLFEIDTALARQSASE
jgi:hypothetical protein